MESQSIFQAETQAQMCSIESPPCDSERASRSGIYRPFTAVATTERHLSERARGQNVQPNLAPGVAFSLEILHA